MLHMVTSCQYSSGTKGVFTGWYYSPNVHQLFHVQELFFSSFGRNFFSSKVHDFSFFSSFPMFSTVYSSYQGLSKRHGVSIRDTLQGNLPWMIIIEISIRRLWNTYFFHKKTYLSISWRQALTVKLRHEDHLKFDSTS